MFDNKPKKDTALVPGREHRPEVGSRDSSVAQRFEGMLLPSSREELEGDSRQKNQKLEQAARVRDEQGVEQLRIDSLRSAQLATQQRRAPHENILKRNISTDRA